ncbi:aldo/keto reductase [Scleromatobacter humisilvae]|uniref:Aldo/keto reductase n=1 Tax=Scleromatobacter humisilvae TaxID=2897159 RepID=A0A9X1YGG0_9BURK|nr:aldo/keto reductase [Scleromatobacter humisilvae]MCK9685583.1 aldo/keto reductase [Scleromatobacter humisilvae]
MKTSRVLTILGRATPPHATHRTTHGHAPQDLPHRRRTRDPPPRLRRDAHHRPGHLGPPADREGALATLRRLPELGVDFIDTANSYGPEVSEELIREALYPYSHVTVATKGGLERSGPDIWTQNGNPSHLVSEAHASRERLGVEQIALWQLHRIDSKVPRDEQFEAVKLLLDDGVIAHAGLSEVSVEDIVEAAKVFPVATVQNRYNFADRGSEDVLKYCEAHGIGFIPWFPLAAGEHAREGSALDAIAKAHGATPSQIAVAWLLQRSPVIIPIPGTSRVAHLEENMKAGEIELTQAEFDQLDKAGSQRA